MSKEEETFGERRAREREEEYKRNARQDRLYNFLFVVALVVAFALIVAARAYIVGGFNECFWAHDLGTCLAIQGSQ